MLAEGGARLLPLLHTDNVCYLTLTTMQKKTVKLSGSVPDTLILSRICVAIS